MKIIIFAIILIICGIPTIADPDNAAIGILCTIVGIVMIVFKLLFRSEYNRQQEANEDYIRSREKQAELARIEWEKQEQERLQKSEAWDSVHKKWQVIMDEHNRLMNEIGVAYTIANNLNLPDSPQMQHVIELCKKDIALAEMYQKSQDEIQQVRIANGWADANEPTKSITTFPTFKRLAIIYEKQKEYDSAIAVCQRAIELGYVDDGTDGQMPGRIARLINKKGKSSKKIKPAEEIVVEDAQDA